MYEQVRCFKLNFQRSEMYTDHTSSRFNLINISNFTFMVRTRNNYHIWFINYTVVQSFNFFLFSTIKSIKSVVNFK